MKKPSVLLFLLLMFSTVAATLFVNHGKADPFPPPKTDITIENPQNRSYNVNAITLVFSVESISFFPQLHFYYSLDGQERTSIENVTIVSDEFVPINPGIYMKNMKGNCVLGNLSAGWHNVTVYEISHVNDDPQNEEIIYSANAQFKIDKAPEAPENSQSKPEPFPTVLFTAVSVAVAAGVAGGVLVYSKKLGGERNS